MAVRTPLKYDGSNNLIEMDATDIANIKTEMIRLYGLSPSVTITTQVSGGNLGTINDTRYQAGTYLTSTTAYPTQAATPDAIQIIGAAYSRMNKNIATLSAPVDTNNKAFPVYLTASGHVQSMTLTDMYDTFVNDVINTLTAASTTTNQAGTYTINTATTLAGATLIDATPVFSDTRADLTVYTATGIPEVLDQPITITNYYLFRIDSAAAGTLPLPVYIDGSNNLQQFSAATLQTMLTDVVDYYATQVGSRVDYVLDLNTTGSRGSGIANTDHTGVTSNYQVLFVNSNDYRSQEFPTGTPATIATYYLRCIRT